MKQAPRFQLRSVRPSVCLQLGGQRRAVTVIELLIVIVVLGLLLSLLLPAVHSVRETARKMQCESRLKQIGIAIVTYESDYGMLPPGNLSFGWHARLLPYLDRPDLAEAVARDDVNSLRTVVVSEFLCPSDSASATLPVHSSETGPAASSYAGNSGTGVLAAGFNGLFQHWESVLNVDFGHGPVRIRDIVDGTSYTAAVTEILHADGRPDQLRSIWNTARFVPDQGQFARVCRSVPAAARSLGWTGEDWDRGSPWISGDQGVTLYNHVLTPNLPSCFNGTDVQTGAFTAASLHAGGVNVLFGDGHIEFISNSVSEVVWYDFGSRKPL